MKYSTPNKVWEPLKSSNVLNAMHDLGFLITAYVSCFRLLGVYREWLNTRLKLELFVVTRWSLDPCTQLFLYFVDKEFFTQIFRYKPI